MSYTAEKAVDRLAEKRREMGALDFAEYAFLVLGMLGTHSPDVLEFLLDQADRALKIKGRPTVSEWFAVLHEVTHVRSDGETRTDIGVASMVHATREGAENALAYCLGMQERGKPGSDGRYFIVTMREALEGDDQ